MSKELCFTISYSNRYCKHKRYLTLDKSNPPIRGAIVSIEQNGKFATKDQDRKHQIVLVAENTKIIKIVSES